MKMKKINLVKTFAVAVFLISVFYAVLAWATVLKYEEDFYGVFVIPFALFFSAMAIASVFMMENKKIFKLALMLSLVLMGIFWVIAVNRFGSFLFYLDGIIYMLVAVLLFLSRHKKICIHISCWLMVAMISYQGLMIIAGVRSTISLGILFNFALLLYCYFLLDGEVKHDTVAVEEVETSSPIITADDITKELQFLEFQLEKNYITEEEYNAKRAEFLMNIAKL